MRSSLFFLLFFIFFFIFSSFVLEMLARISRGNEVAGVIAERKKDVLCVGN